MTQKQAVELLLKGAFVVIAEYRSFRIEPMQYRDKKTGQMVSQHIAKHSLEVGDTQVQVQEWLRDDAVLTEVRQPFPKGTRIVCELQELNQERGFVSARGKLHPFVADGVAEAPKAGGSK